MLSGAAEEHPSCLCLFVLLSYADLKKFVYWSWYEYDTKSSNHLLHILLPAGQCFTLLHLSCCSLKHGQVIHASCNLLPQHSTACIMQSHLQSTVTCLKALQSPFTTTFVSVVFEPEAVPFHAWHLIACDTAGLPSQQSSPLSLSKWPEQPPWCRKLVTPQLQRYVNCFLLLHACHCITQQSGTALLISNSYFCKMLCCCMISTTNNVHASHFPKSLTSCSAGTCLRYEQTTLPQVKATSHDTV